MSTISNEQPDDTIPSSERQEELRAMYAANIATGQPPYYHVHIRTRGELAWIMHERGWRGDVDRFTRDEAATHDVYYVPADFRGANFSGTNLANVKLELADLREAYFMDSILTGSVLVDAVLVDAQLRRVQASGVKLRHTNLEHSHFRDADLSDADIAFANLRSARFSRADLRGTNLYGTHMDASTVLSEAIFDTKTQLGDVIWNGALLMLINWNDIPRLAGEERFFLSKVTNGASRSIAYRNIARAYRGLAATLKAQGVAGPAGRYRLLEQRFERRALRTERRGWAWLGSLILDLVAGYGERPGRAFIAYLLVVLGFAGGYFSVGQLSGLDLSPVGALIFSLTSFHGRGFFPGSITTIDGPLTILAACEAVLGLFIELIFIATFSRRFLNE